MMIRRIAGCTRVVGKEQGYVPLPLRDETVRDTASGRDVNCMTMAFEPTHAEIEQLFDGASIYVSMFGTSPPPMILSVGPIERDPYHDGRDEEVARQDERAADPGTRGGGDEAPEGARGSPSDRGDGAGLVGDVVAEPVSALVDRLIGEIAVWSTTVSLREFQINVASEIVRNLVPSDAQDAAYAALRMIASDCEEQLKIDLRESILAARLTG